MNTPEILTDRLILRKFTLDDIESFYAIYSDEKVNRFLPWFPLKSIEEAKQFYKERYESEYAKDVGYKYAICLKEDNQPIGYVNVSMSEEHDFGYGLRKEYWHKGIVSEASLAVLNQLRKDGIPFITATHDIHNPRSGNVMKKLGMKYEYSYDELWQPKNIMVTFRMYQLNFNENVQIYKKYWDMYPHRTEEID